MLSAKAYLRWEWSKWIFFLWQTQIQMIKYGLNDTKRIKKKQVSFTPSDMNFQAILMPKVILKKCLSQKIYLLT